MVDFLHRLLERPASVVRVAHRTGGMATTASASQVIAAPTRRAASPPANNQIDRAMVLADRSGNPLTRFNIPKDVQRRFPGAVAANRIASRHCVIPM